MKKIAITQGDVNGIGIEVILKTFADASMFDLCTPIVYGSLRAFNYYKRMLQIEHPIFATISSPENAQNRKLNIIECNGNDLKIEAGRPTEDAGMAAFKALERCLSDIKKGLVDGVVTAPISKKTIQNDKFNFPGHTEYFTDRNGDKESLMMLMAENLRVALVTNHVPITQVSENITEERIIKKLEILNQSLKEDFMIVKPRIAVLALNPHASDNGLLGKEEQEVICPALKKASETGICCIGPISADGFFGSGDFKKYDAVLAMYHDQGLTAFKALYMEQGVNYTAGLDIIRTSPAHGTAFAIAGKNEADPFSFRHAVYSICDIIENRKLYKEFTANPLVIKPEELNGQRRDS